MRKGGRGEQSARCRVGVGLHQGVVQIARHRGIGQRDPQVVPNVRGERGLGDLCERGFGTAGHLFDAILSVAPAADVPPRPVVVIQEIEQDQKAFRAAHLARLQADGVAGPVGIAGSRIAIGRERALLVGAVVGIPTARINSPAVRALIDEIALIQRYPVAGHHYICVLHGSVPRAEADAAVQAGVGRVGGKGHGGGEDGVAAILAEQFLNIVGGRAEETARAVIINHVRQPLDAVQIGKERRVGGHLHNIGIAFHAGHEGGFAQRGTEIAIGAVSRGYRVFANKDFGAGPAVTVIFGGIRNEGAGAGIIMFIRDLHRPAGGQAAPVGGNQMDRRVVRPDGIIKVGEIGVVIGAAVFVADFQKFQIERGGMAVGGAQRTPGRIGGAIRILDQIQGILHPRAKLAAGDGIIGAAIVAQCQPGVDVVQRLHAHVLAVLEIFVEAKAVGGPVAPGVVVMAGPVGAVADGFLPAHRIGERVRFDEVSARETEERWMERGEHARQVRAQSVGATVGGAGGEQ